MGRWAIAGRGAGEAEVDEDGEDVGREDEGELGVPDQAHRGGVGEEAEGDVVGGGAGSRAASV